MTTAPKETPTPWATKPYLTPGEIVYVVAANGKVVHDGIRNDIAEFIVAAVNHGPVPVQDAVTPLQHDLPVIKPVVPDAPTQRKKPLWKRFLDVFWGIETEPAPQLPLGVDFDERPDRQMNLAKDVMVGDHNVRVYHFFPSGKFVAYISGHGVHGNTVAAASEVEALSRAHEYVRNMTADDIYDWRKPL